MDGWIKCVLIRLEKEEESAAGRLMLWLHSVVPASAPPPKTTATDHWWVSIYSSRSDYREKVQCGKCEKEVEKSNYKWIE